MTVTIPTDYQVHLFHEGNLFRSFELFGAHIIEYEGVIGTRFSVWAPNAVGINLVGNFNNWDGKDYPLSKINDQGIWTIFISENLEDEIYKYEIKTQNGETILKADPYAFYAELKPNTASVVYNIEGYNWGDKNWFKQKQKKASYDQPMFIYELHVGTWKKHKDDSYYTYVELVEELIPYVLEHGYTHIELLPLVEHPFDKSWGYQGTGYYAPTSRYGTPHELMFFIDKCHENGIGVILDWVPGHFCKDAHGLYMFDGLPVYEYMSYKDRENEVWGTANFDLGKPEVHSFLISNAIYWMELFHIDGFRVDAVANMLYWANPTDKLVENSFAIQFFKKLNETVFSYDPTILMIAEDSTDWPLVTAPTSEGGLGFNYKWNMGWMNDILTYMEADPSIRSSLHHKVTFSLVYAFSENFILPFSHDEVVHGKKSMLDKMPGDYWRKFAQLRLLYGYHIAHPGKKLLFMGGEFGQFIEWNDNQELDWFLDEYDMHNNLRSYNKELIRLYKKYKALHELDHSHECFEWIDVNNTEQSIFSFIRKGKKESDMLIIVCNFREHVYHDYKIGVPLKTSYKEELNSDDIKYGGSGQVNKKQIEAEEEFHHGRPYSISITVPPFGISILRPIKRRRESAKSGAKKVRSNVTSRGTR